MKRVPLVLCSSLLPVLILVSWFIVIKGEPLTACVTATPNGTLPGSQSFEIDFPANKNITFTTIYTLTNPKNQPVDTLHQYWLVPGCELGNASRPDRLNAFESKRYSLDDPFFSSNDFSGEIHVLSSIQIGGISEIVIKIAPVAPTATANQVHLPFVSYVMPATPTLVPTETPSPTSTPSHEGGDTTPPVLISWSLAPTAIDTSLSDQVITFTAHFKDDLSGLTDGTIGGSGTSPTQAAFISPSGKQSINVIFEPPQNLISGTAQDGIYKSKMILPRFSESGEWFSYRVLLMDDVGNDGWLYRPDLAARGLVISFHVTNNH